MKMPPKKLAWLFASIFLSFPHAVFASENSTTSSCSEDRSHISKDLAQLVTYINDKKSEEKKIYTHRASIIGEIRELLISNESVLAGFPLLDEHSYNELIECMKKRLKKDKEDAPALVYIWSFLTNIPVVGLKRNSQYYELNNHLLPHKDEPEAIEVRFDADKICAKSGASKQLTKNHKHYQMTDELLFSVVLFRAEYLTIHGWKNKAENAEIAWKLLKKEVVPLTELASSAQTLLKCLLRINHKGTKKPFYRLSTIRLLQNTAIYLSQEDAEAATIVLSPCSEARVNFLGFQDGIFLPTKTCSADGIHKMLGSQLFIRIFFHKTPCINFRYPEQCKPCQNTMRATFYPHFTFFADPDLKKQIRIIRKEGDSVNEAMEKFSDTWLQYVNAPDRVSSSTETIKKILAYMNIQQLSSPLCLDPVSDERKIFEPSVSVDLSYCCSSKLASATQERIKSVPTPSYASSASDETPNKDPNPSQNASDLTSLDSADSLVSHLIELLQQVDYQILETLNLAHNKLEDSHMKSLGNALATNLAANLQSIDLTGNKISVRGILKLKKLLKRDSFQTLRVDATTYSQAEKSLEDILLQKLERHSPEGFPTASTSIDRGEEK